MSTSSAGRATAAAASAGSFYGYYELLSLPPPSSSSWLARDRAGASSSAEITEELLKKHYRKAALVHHPDKGGSEETFLECKKARDCLADDERKAKYDAMGIDLGPGDDSKNLQQLGSTILTGLLSFLMRLVITFVVLNVLLYSYVSAAVLLATSWVAWKKMSDFSNQSRCLFAAVTTLVSYLVKYSGKGGWMFWLFESFLVCGTWCLGFELPFGRTFVAVSFASSLVASWFLCGAFYRYFVVSLITLLLVIISVVAIPLCETLVKEEVERAMKEVEVRVKGAVQEEIRRRA